MKKKKIAIIGSGTMAVAFSTAANEMGIESHCFSNDKNAIVSDICTEHHIIDIFDIDKIKVVCNKIGISGVIATTELTVSVAARIAGDLNLKGIPVTIANKVTDKYYVRSHVNESCGLLQPNYKLLSLKDDGPAPLNFPVVVKPTSLGGKRGILVANNNDEYCKALKYANNNIPSNRCKIMIEEFLTGGREFSVESLSYNGKHMVIQITEKITSGPPHIVELGHLQPARISESTRNRINNAVQELLIQIGIDNTSTHTEIKLVGDKLYLIEVNSRPGGDNIASKLVKLSTGYDYLKGAISIALGEFKFPDKANFINHTSGLIFITSQTANMKGIFNNCERQNWCIEKHEVRKELTLLETNNSWGTNYIIFNSLNGIPRELKAFFTCAY